MKKALDFLKKYRGYHLWLLAAAALSSLYYALRGSRTAMNAVVSVTLPLRQLAASVCDLFPFSAGEILCGAAILFALFFIVRSAVVIIRGPERFERFYRRACGALAALLSLNFLLCVNLGANYFADSFQDESGIYGVGGTTEELYALTAFFAKKTAESSQKVPRDENGVFCEPVADFAARSGSIYGLVEERFPFLKMRGTKPKSAAISRIMSYLNYTGFYFPLTGEANINADAPLCFIPSTIAHEFAHQRGVASEQECNFLAVLACVTCGDPAYEYSGWLLGYTYLSNALAGRDYALFAELYLALPADVRADLTANGEYWEKYETKISEVSDQIYDSFLQGQGQELGIASYGAVVDLLLAYFG